MIEKANQFDELGFYFEADKVDRCVTSQFNLKKRKINPLLTIQNQINGLSAKIEDFMSENGGDDSPTEEKDITVMVDNKPVDIISK